MMEELTHLRNEIDRLDVEWLQLFAKRFEQTRQVVELKRLEHLPAVDALREAELFDEVVVRHQSL